MTDNVDSTSAAPEMLVQKEDGLVDAGPAETQCGESVSSESIDGLKKWLTREQKFLDIDQMYSNYGCKAFEEQVTNCQVYHATRGEKRAIALAKDAVASIIGKGASVIEFGCSSAQKIEGLLKALDTPKRIFCNDINAGAVDLACVQLQERFENVEILPAVGNFENIDVSLGQEGPRLGLFFGPTTSHYDQVSLVPLFKNFANVIGKDGYILFGVDIVKPKEVVEKYYNGPGVLALNAAAMDTMEFNFHAKFDREAFVPQSEWKPEEQDCELQLRVSKDTKVSLPDGFEANIAKETRLIVCRSHKYTVQDVDTVLQGSSMEKVESWVDEESQIMLVLAKAA